MKHRPSSPLGQTATAGGIHDKSRRTPAEIHGGGHGDRLDLIVPRLGLDHETMEKHLDPALNRQYSPGRYSLRTAQCFARPFAQAAGPLNRLRPPRALR